MADSTNYDKLAEKIFCKGSKLIPQLFRMVADEEEAALLLALPGSAAEAAKKLDREAALVENSLEELFKKGLVFKSKKPEGTKYRMCRDIAQFHDASILWSGATRAYYDLWQRYMEEEWPGYARFITKMMKKPFTRVIPVEKSVEGRGQILAHEDVKHMIETATRVAVTRCTCRVIAHKCDNPIEICLQINKAADYTLERGSGREISKEEALGLAREAAERGLIHVTMNKAEVSHFICNCCTCCCQTFPLLISEGLPLNDPSRFRAQVDEDSCNACGVCLDRCHFSAISLAAHNGGEVAVVNIEKCMGCGLCAIKCETESISMIEARQPSFIPA
jgi:NAD-dependent dihydropyrimidine dehydrogenase PreA subunit